MLLKWDERKASSRVGKGFPSLSPSSARKRTPVLRSVRNRPCRRGLVDAAKDLLQSVDWPAKLIKLGHRRVLTMHGKS